MSELGVFLGGEGANELGSYSGHASYYDDRQPGVLVALLRLVRPSGWRVVGATKWSKIRKLRAHGPSRNEARNVQALILDAKEAKADVLAFIRDSDGDQSRAHDIELAISAHEAARKQPDVIGGVAIPVLEAWLLRWMASSGQNSSARHALRGVSSRSTSLQRLPSES